MHLDLDHIWTAPPVPTCQYLDNCTAVLRGGCASCGFVHGRPFDSDCDPVGLMAVSAMAPATGRPARRANRGAGCTAATL